MSAPLHCRQCGAELSQKADSCPHCNCRPPFQCSVCEAPLGAITLRVPRSSKYPYGSFTESGEPCCHQHRPTRCYRCSGLFHKEQLRRSPGKENVLVCEECATRPREAASVAAPPGPLTRLGWFLGIILLLGLALLAGAIGTLLFNTRI